MQTKALVLVLVASSSLSAMAFQSSHKAVMVTACINKSTGALRIAKSCSSIESEFIWNIKGAKGAKGAIGLTGATGATGIKGAIGLTGAAGAAGANGHDGLRGIQIWYGTTDPTQSIGLSGDFYVNTQTNVWFGPKVETWSMGVSIVGPVGATGPAGPAGLMGATGTSGALGAVGGVGATGPVGPTGPSGPAGSAGASAIAITQLSICGASGTSLCQIGSQGPGGGIIFFVDYQNQYPGFNYLEVAPLGCEQLKKWSRSTSASLASVANWDSRAVGSGLANTNAIVAAGDTSEAAFNSRTVSCGGKSDWFLPSIGESLLMIANLEGLDLFHTDGNYWTSNQIDASNAATINLNLASIGFDLKSSTTTYMRAIREF